MKRAEGHLLLNLTLFQPEIAQNMGAVIRLCACFGITLNVIEPCGFPFSSKALKRAAMDYAHFAEVKRHVNFKNYYEKMITKVKNNRLILFSTKGNHALWDFKFHKNDHLIFGNESSGVPTNVSEQVDSQVYIPMPGRGRSLNIAVSAGIGLAEATRQLAYVEK